MIAGVFDEFLGVPLHPLAVHAPVVLIPLLAIVSVAVLLRPAWRERSSIPIAVVAFVMVAMLFVAKESGEAAKEAENVFGDIDRHEELANQTFILGIVWLVLAIGAAVAVFLARTGRLATPSSADAVNENGDRVILALNALATVALIVTTIWLIRTGHAGAESRWKI